MPYLYIIFVSYGHKELHNMCGIKYYPEINILIYFFFPLKIKFCCAHNDMNEMKDIRI